MKKILLALLVLMIAVPAMAAVNITAQQSATEPNKVIISYQCTGGENVRAFAVNVGLNKPVYRVGSAARLSNDYYVTPTNITFTAVDGNTVINQLGSPVVGETTSGCVLEMASLYAAGDPLHPSAPPASGDLAKFGVLCSQGRIIVTLTSETTLRGGVILTNGTVVTPNYTSATFYTLALNETCGGVPITQTRYNNWLTTGKPQSWGHPGHYMGDCTQDCAVTAPDIVGPNPTPNMKASFTKAYPDAAYQASCDTNDDMAITALDILGDGSIPGSGAKPNFTKVVPAPCP